MSTQTGVPAQVMSLDGDRFRVLSLGLAATEARALLRRDALLMARLAAADALPTWSRHPGFAARVRHVRRELAPLERVGELLDSFGREALHAFPYSVHPCAVRTAYALRWIELSTRRRQPDWAELVAGVPAR